MAGSNQQIAVNGSELWVYVIEIIGRRAASAGSTSTGCRLNLDVGSAVFRSDYPGRLDMWLFVTNVTGTAADRLGDAGEAKVRAAG